MTTRDWLRGLALAVVAVGVSSASARGQLGGVWVSDEHGCGDCHAPHTDGRGRSALVRSGTSELTPMAPGLGPFSLRCLECHGSAGDRQQARSDRTIPLAGATYLGANLHDDHALGRVTVNGVSTDRGSFDPLGGGQGSPLQLLRNDLGPDLSVECGSCHDPHDPWLITQQTQVQDDTCLACHSPEFDLGGHGIASCGSCHRTHGAPEVEHLLRELRPESLCGACHDGGALPLNLGIDPVPGRPVHTDPADRRCGDCHRIHRDGGAP